MKQYMREEGPEGLRLGQTRDREILMSEPTAALSEVIQEAPEQGIQARVLDVLRNVSQKHAELLLVVTVLIVVSAVFHWIPYKIAFLNFFYLPVLVGGYLLGARRAVLSSVACILLVLLYYLWFWTREVMAATDAGFGVAALLTVLTANWPTLFSIAMWGGFLMLSGAVVGRLHERAAANYSRVSELNQELQSKADELHAANTALQASSQELHATNAALQASSQELRAANTALQVSGGELQRVNAEMQQVNAALQATGDELKARAEELESKNLLVERLKQQVEETLYSTMDSTVARLMIQGRLRQEKRTISVLFCDLKGFSGFEESRHPEVILENLNEFYEVMEEVVETYHGHIDKYMGDGIMCEFGAPIDYEQHGLHAALAGLKMQERFQEQQIAYGLRIGIASGDAIVGLLGKRRRSYSAIGEVVNLASRLEKLCEPGTVYIDEQTCEAITPLMEVMQIRSLTGRRAEDRHLLDLIAEKDKELEKDPNNADILFEIGKLYYRLQEASKALGYLRRAMAVRPDDVDIKILYADASMKRDEFEKISIRGMEQRRAVYKVVGFVDPLANRERFPQSFYDQYASVRTMLEIPDSVVHPIEAMDATIGHSEVVAVVSYALADRMGVPDDFKRDLLVAARLQDLGKSVVWHHILNRRGGLSDQERKDLEAHVTESLAIARRMGFNQPRLLEVIANHHELLNGAGYPHGLTGDAIPLGARIAGVADLYSAITAWRPYRPAWNSRVALNELRKGANAGRLDPAVVEALWALLS
jgi:HD-GYP domain-containing protein (c-di-GMP phosphodiesterase class II)